LEDAFTNANKVVKNIIDEHKATSVSTVGYCYGAKVCYNILSNSEYSAKIGCTVINHPSFLTDDDASNCAVKPVLFNCAETDGMFTEEFKAKFWKLLETRGIKVDHVDYKGTNHGFTLRLENDSQNAKDQRDLATKNTAEFVAKHAF